MKVFWGKNQIENLFKIKINCNFPWLHLSHRAYITHLQWTWAFPQLYPMPPALRLPPPPLREWNLPQRSAGRVAGLGAGCGRGRSHDEACCNSVFRQLLKEVQIGKLRWIAQKTNIFMYENIMEFWLNSSDNFLQKGNLMRRRKVVYRKLLNFHD